MMKNIFALATLLVALGSVSAGGMEGERNSSWRRHHNRVAERFHETREIPADTLSKRSFNTFGTFYQINSGDLGACGGGLSPNGYTVALAQPLYGGLNSVSQYCGMTITIYANGKSHTATIADACPTGGGNCGGSDLDMTQALFEYFAPTSVGKMPITWVFGDAAAAAESSSSAAASRSSAAAASRSSASRASSISASKARVSSLSAKSHASVLSVSRASVSAAKASAAAAAAAAASGANGDSNNANGPAPTPAPVGDGHNFARLGQIVDQGYYQMANGAKN